MAIHLRPTELKCCECRSTLDAAEGVRACPHCSAGPLCPLCLDDHTRVKAVCDRYAARIAWESRNQGDSS